MLRSLLAFMLAGLAGCGGTGIGNPDGGGSVDDQLKTKVQNIVFIYAENRSFDNLFAAFPGANGADAAKTNAPQLDRDGSMLPKLPQTWGGVTAAGQMPVVTQAQSDNLPNAAYLIDSTYSGVDVSVITRDLYHRFFENQMQIDGGKNDKFAAFADSGGLVMGHYDASKTQLWKLAQKYVLADNFFMGAFGGSFLNHQYLICGCAPEYPNADTSPAKPSINVVDSDAGGAPLPSLTIDTTKSPASALDGAPVFVKSGNVAPASYFGDGTFRAVNTMQPAYQPSANAPATSDATKLYADPNAATTLPPQTGTTIGDLLDAKQVTWAWYAGAWNETLTAATGMRDFGPSTPGAAPQFQFHHQPFNYYTKFDPQAGAAARQAHLQDYDQLVSQAAAGTLPSVVFYKPEGDLNQHAGYASVAAGDQHLADVVAKLQASPQWKGMVIVITYDENGGWWDHVAPPKGDKLGPGTRIPALIISPFAKQGFVDHTQYDTASIQRLINRRYGLSPLPGVTARDKALEANGGTAMGDFTNALEL
jgi:acid phosphatase